MIEHLPRIPHFVTTCWKFGLHIEEVAPGVWETWCEAANECYGCDGISRFECSVYPRGFKWFKTHYSQGIIPNTKPQRLWLNDEEIAEVLEEYKDKEERYFWNREISADLDSIVIYKWEEVIEWPKMF